MLKNYFERKLASMKKLQDIEKGFCLVEELRQDLEFEEYLELRGKVIAKAYDLNYKKECFDFVKDIELDKILDFELRSCLTHILVRTSLIADKIKHPVVQQISLEFDPDLYHENYKAWLAINSALVLRKSGLITRSTELMENCEFLKEDNLALLQLSLNYSFLDRYDKEIEIYDKLEKVDEQWVRDILFFRKAKLFIKREEKKKLKKLMSSCDIYSLLKPIEYRNARSLELYDIFTFLGDNCKALFYLRKATENKYNKNEVEISSKQRALEILKRAV